jgi:hypothetical protein
MLWEIASGQEELTDGSGDIRYQILRGSIRAFADSPIVRHGWGAKTEAVDASPTRRSSIRPWRTTCTATC